MPSFYLLLNLILEIYLSQRIERGKVEFNIRIKEIEEDVSITIDKAVASAGIEALKELSQLAGIDSGISLSNLMRMEGVFKKVKNRDLDYYRDLIFSALDKTYLQYDENRNREADRTAEDINNKILVIEGTVNKIEKRAETLEDDIKNNLRDKFKDLLGDNIDDNRIYTETAVMLVRFSINEEIVRLRSHIDGLERLSTQAKLL